MREPVLREISKKTYYKALRKCGYQDDDFPPVELFCGKAGWFCDHYKKEPIIRYTGSICDQFMGRDIIGYKYYKIVGWREVIFLIQQFVDAMKEHGIDIINNRIL